jgi:UDP-N-acetylmuramate--alanine ligase
MYRKKAHIHFVGIGGIGMSGIAQILHQQGSSISGCDSNIAQKSVLELKSLGCAIYEGNNTEKCKSLTIDILVYSSAIEQDNPEIITAQQRGIPTIRRALMLAELMRTKYSIAIAGAHGKTTTTSLVSHILIEAGLDPTVIIGGHLINISSNARMGQGDFLVAEADESDRSFLHLQASLALVTNIDLEHLETYADIDDIIETYKRFLNNLPFYGIAFVCIDDQNIQKLFPMPHLRLIKYGLHQTADIRAVDISLHADHSTFNLVYQTKKFGTVRIHMPGKHNILNCLGAIAICLEVGVSFDTIQKALEHFQGIERRFWFRKSYHGAEIFDDYAHHPKEIEQTLIVAAKRTKKRLIVIFQPHRFTRTYHLWNDFLTVFHNTAIDRLIITDIYSASEQPIENVSSEIFVNEFQKKYPEMNCSYIPFDKEFKHLLKAIDTIAEPDDLILLIGAGKLTDLPQFLTHSNDYVKKNKDITYLP